MPAPILALHLTLDRCWRSVSQSEKLPDPQGDGAPLLSAHGQSLPGARDRRSHDTAFLRQVRRARVEFGLGWGDLAVLSESSVVARSHEQLLRDEGVPVVSLEEYAGRTVDAVKVGTFRLTKGLEFPAVLLPLLTRGAPPRHEGEAEPAYEERVARERRALYAA